MPKQSKLLAASARLAQLDAQKKSTSVGTSAASDSDEPYLLPLEDIADQLERSREQKQKWLRVVGISVLGSIALMVSFMSYLKQQQQSRGADQAVSTVLQSKQALLQTYQPNQGFVFTKTNLDQLISHGIDPRLPLSAGQLQVQALPSANGFVLTVPSSNSKLCQYLIEQLQSDFHSISVDQNVLTNANMSTICQAGGTNYALSFIHYDPSITIAPVPKRRPNSQTTPPSVSPSSSDNQPLVPLRPPIEPGSDTPADVRPDYGPTQPKPVPPNNALGLTPPTPDAQLVMLPD